MAVVRMGALRIAAPLRLAAPSRFVAVAPKSKEEPQGSNSGLPGALSATMGRKAIQAGAHLTAASSAATTAARAAPRWQPSGPSGPAASSPRPPSGGFKRPGGGDRSPSSPGGIVAAEGVAAGGGVEYFEGEIGPVAVATSEDGPASPSSAPPWLVPAAIGVACLGGLLLLVRR